MRGSDGWIRAVSHQVGLRVSRRARVTGHRRHDQCTSKYRNESSVRFHGSELLWLDLRTFDNRGDSARALRDSPGPGSALIIAAVPVSVNMKNVGDDLRARRRCVY